MSNTLKRGRLQAVCALAITTMLVMLMVLFAGTPANAQSQPLPDNTQVTITKLTQPEQLGKVATGEQISNLPEGAAPISGVAFNYYKVGDIDNNQQQRDAATRNPGEFDLNRSPDGPFARTGADGVTTATLPRGLYVVVEDPTTIPAGVTASAPFMLTVPLTDPTNRDAWLDHIYIYPKSSQVSVDKSIENAAAHVVGDTVTWTITADIPRVQNPGATGANDQFQAPDYFRIDDQIQANQLALSPVYAAGSNGAIKVTTGSTTLVEGNHYSVNEVPAGAEGNTYQIEFTEAGRQALASSVNSNPSAQVRVDIVTRVQNTGHIENTASVFPNQNSVAQNRALATNSAEIRYGGFNVQKRSSNASVEDLSGAQFRVYDSEESAKKQGVDNLKPSIGPKDGLWTTDANGQLSINGLRYSDFANGVAVDANHQNYVTYYLVETRALPGHQLLAEPIKFTVTENTGASEPSWVGDIEVVNQATSGAFVLPLTGGRGTWMLILLGIAVLALVAILARRRSIEEA